MKLLALSTILFLFHLASAQNCLNLKSQGDVKRYEACLIGESAQFYNQFSKEYQQIYDSAIETCPYFATAYHAKSVAYLKSGNFIEWKKLIDKAVELDPKEYLGNRASCRFQFVHDYEGAIKDIEKLSSIIDYDIGYTSDGDYHLDIVKAICFKQIGNNKKAIQLFDLKLNEEGYTIGLYDYYHLGNLYKEERMYEEAIKKYEMQIEINASAEVYYQIAMAYKGLNDKSTYKKYILESRNLYLKGNKLAGNYTEYIDNIYLETISQEIEDGL